MITETSNSGNSRGAGRQPFVPSQRLESYFLSLARQLETWRGRSSDSASIGICGLRSGVGASTVAFNLAACLASSRSLSVCVLECNFGNPFVSRRIGQDLPGVSDAMAGTVEIGKCCHPAGPDGLSLVGPGTLGVSAANRLVSSSFNNVLADVRGQFDWIVCDLPVASPLTTCFDLSSTLDGVVLVTGKNDGADPETRDVGRQFRNLGIDLIGLVQNDC